MTATTGASLAGRVAVVTGGTRGIGRAIAEAMGREGAQVVVVGRDVSAASAASEIPGTAFGITCDVRDEHAVDRTFRLVADDLGPVDVLVNNAGINADGMAHRLDVEDFRRVLDVNLVGTWLCSRAAVRILRQHGLPGSIVNLSSVAAIAGNLGQSNYAASKAGIEALTKSMARENATLGIRVNAIRPGLVRTDMTRALDQSSWDAILRSVPLGRCGEPEEVASVAVFLASAMSSYVTGTVVDVSGGRGMAVYGG